MPELDGWATLERIRDLSDVPVIMLTARSAELERVRGLTHGADDYIAKPFSPRELVARIRGQLALAGARRRTEELNSFLVRFSDAVRAHPDEREVARIACRILAEHLGCSLSYWTEVDWVLRSGPVDGQCDRLSDGHRLVPWRRQPADGHRRARCVGGSAGCSGQKDWSSGWWRCRRISWR